jgi:phosphoribosylformylglycinamidine synthase I
MPIVTKMAMSNQVPMRLTYHGGGRNHGKLSRRNRKAAAQSRPYAFKTEATQLIEALMKSAVIVFPGSNCDRDAARALERITGKPASMVWHKDTVLPEGLDLVVLPGGFSYGDYLRSGAMAAKSPVMREVIAHAERGGLVLGICNGFQVLTETRLLPGALARNAGLKFACKDVPLAIDNGNTAFTRAYRETRQTEIPIAHGDGRFVADDATLDRIEGEGRVVFRYIDNPNGSARDIAGIINDRGNVMGMMPHPERASDPVLGRIGGRAVFESLMEAA